MFPVVVLSSVQFYILPFGLSFTDLKQFTGGNQGNSKYSLKTGKYQEQSPLPTRSPWLGQVGVIPHVCVLKPGLLRGHLSS